MATLDYIKDRKYFEANINDIEVDTLNVRTEGRKNNLDVLKASIENVGLIHPILLTEGKGNKKFKVLVGQRRFRAFEELKREEIPAILINNVNELTKRIISFSENVNRTKLPYNDTIRVCDELFSKYTGTQSKRLEQVAADVGLSLQTVTKYLSYRIIPKEVRDMVAEKKLDPKQAYKLTTAFWPKSEKIVKIARHMIGMTKPEWDNILDVGMENKDASIEEILAEAKKPSRKIKLTVLVDRSDFDKIQGIANNSKNKIGIEDLLTEIIKGYVRGQEE
ncbi:MAG: ParB/RepB/Spo0J family partition protein [Candidatus Diapherotrites archaeon]|nr:ParB/RepB/Spo0J family partition protein [Candidatus Diapherotrites archaeon]